MNFSVHLDCWPVGQGLFMSGHLEYECGKKFRWVYDCGSVSRSACLHTAINGYSAQLGSNRLIDLVTISHFDADHINGMVALLKGKRVKYLLLPYLHLWQRLLIGIAGGAKAGDSIWELYIDPKKYLQEQGVDPDVTVYVLAEGQEFDGEGLEITSAVNIDLDKDSEKASVALKSVALKGKGRLFNVFWEFVPYNDVCLLKKIPPDFLKYANSFKKNRDQTSLNELQKAYDKTFGRGGKRNETSLFLYSGSLDSLLCNVEVNFSNGLRSQYNFKKELSCDKTAQLYTGDGFLNTNELWEILRNYYTLKRIAKIGMFQVPHHGAEGNWHSGLAAKIKPRFSIFSSDPYRKRPHPSRLVWNDFLPYCPVQVGGAIGCHFSIDMQFSRP